ncbi:MAG TPA: hypothetical protein VJS64_01720 [Pyrinomonadaceae bacterium]|nr:hypothetical protein [Pyrinomonadaceae bacterium]
MTKGKLVRLTLAACLVIMTAALAAQAQANRTFIRSNGTDAGTCPVTTPCLTLNFAHSMTNVGGEIVVMDSYGVGQLTITKAITIMSAPGVIGFVKAQPSTSGITVAAGATETVVLRNLVIGGQNGASTTGIFHNSGRLSIENCSVSLLTTGLRAVAGTVVALNSSFSSNTSRGVHVSGTAKVFLENCNISYNDRGVTVDGFGGCPQANPVQPATTIAILNGGVVAGSTSFAFEMLNAGGACPNGQAAHGQNIYLRIGAAGTDFLTNVPNYSNSNTNFLFVQGQASGNQILIGTYQNPNQGRQP